MSVVRINEFQAQAGQGDALRELIASFVPLIEGSDGCRSCRLVQGVDDSTRIVVIEEWDSTEAHQASAKNMPSGAFEEAMKLLSGPPKGEYYHA